MITHLFRRLPLLGLVGLSCAHSAFAQEDLKPRRGCIADMLFQLTLSYTDAGTVDKDQFGKPIKGPDGTTPDYENTYDVVKRGVKTETVDEYVSKITNHRYSTKEFLMDLEYLGVIEDIAGWSLKKLQVTGQESLEFVSTRGPQFYLVHKDPGIEPIMLDNLIEVETYASATAENDVFRILFDSEGEPVGEARSYAATIKREVYLDIDFEDWLDEDEYQEIELGGIYSGKENLQFVGLDKQPVIMLNGEKITSVNGSYYYEDVINDYYYYDVLEGSITFSAGKLVPDVSVYPQPLPNDVIR